MLSKCEIHNANGFSNKAFDEAPATTGFINMQKFTPITANRTITDRDKMQAHGVWPTKPYRGGMSIDIEGSIQANTPANAIAQLDLLTGALYGSPADMVVRKNGTLFVRRLDKTEDWKTDVIVLEFSAPLTAQSTVIEYLVTLFSWTPYFTGVTTGSFFYWT